MTSASGAAPGQRTVLALLLGMVMAIGPLSIDLYLPGLPLIADEFSVPESAVQATLAGTVIGLAVGYLASGTLSDSLGRKIPLVCAVGAHVLSAVLCALAPDIDTLIAARVFMGFASAGGAVVALAVVRDLYRGSGMLRMLAGLAAVSGAAPLVAPVVGSQLLRVVDWRGVFLVLAVYSALVTLLTMFFLRESLPARNRAALRIGEQVRRFRMLLSTPGYVLLVALAALTWGVLFAHLSASPFILRSMLGLDPTQYGPLFVLFSVAYVLGAQLGPRIGARTGLGWMIMLGVALQVAGGAGVVAGGTTGSAAVLLASLTVAVGGVAVCVPTLNALALASHSHMAGAAASMLGGASFLVAGVVTAVAGHAGVSNPIGLGVTLCALSGCALILCAGGRLWRNSGVT